jgi:hypothetical protein
MQAHAMKPTALHFLILTVAGWLQRRREEYIAYLLAENAVYKEHFAKRGIRLTDAQRPRLAVKGKAVGRAGLRQIATIGTPDTILRWYRQLVAQKYDGSRKRGPGRPRARVDITALIVRMTNENPRWDTRASAAHSACSACSSGAAPSNAFWLTTGSNPRTNVASTRAGARFCARIGAPSLPPISSVSKCSR